MRIEMSLNGRWRFCPAFDQISADQRWLDPDFDPANPDLTPVTEGDIGWVRPDFDDSGWLDITIPGSWNSEFEDLWSYEGHGWFRRVVAIPREWEGRRVEFFSEGANYRTVVSVNGQVAGEHSGGYTPFAIPIHRLLKFGEENVIAVSCDNQPKKDRVPGGQFDWWNHGGLYRDVSLRITDNVYIDDVTVDTKLEDGGASVGVSVTARCDGGKVTNRAIDVQLFDPAGEPVLLPATARSQMLAEADGHAAAELNLPVPDALLWTPDEPHLYRLVLTVNDTMHEHNGDTWSMRIGLREIRVDGPRLLLNGRPLLIKGINRYEDYSGDNPGHGRPGHTHDEALLSRDLDLVKWLGANALRSHYPPHRRHFELCDERGILNLVELPLYQWGRPLVETASADALVAAKAQLTEIIGALKNHPSVFMWSVSNENLVVPRSDDPEVVALAKQTADGNIELVELAHELDPTRPAVEVSNCWPGDPVHQHTDVTAINIYVGTNVNDERGLPDTVERARAKIAEQRTELSDKPILATEWGSWAVRGMRTDYFPGEEYQAANIKAIWDGMLEEDNVIGGFVWAFADSDVHRRFLWVYEYRCAYGMFDIHRNAKVSAHTMHDVWTALPTFRD